MSSPPPKNSGPALDPRLAEALALHQQGRAGEARARYAQLLKQAPGNLQARYYQGLLRLQTGEIDAGMADLRQVVKRQPTHAEAHYNLGLAYSQQGKPQQALGCFEQTLALQPGSVEARFYLGLSLAGLGRYDEARAHFEKVIELAPGLAVARLNLGNTLAEMGLHAEALPVFEKALALQPGFAEPHNGLGAALAKLNRYEEAARHFREAIRLKPGMAEAHTGLSDVLRLVGQYQAAIECAEQALRVRPADAAACTVLGQSLAKLNRHHDALMAFERALVLDPDNAGAHNELGGALHLWGRHQEAWQHGERAIQLAPDNADMRSGQLFNLHYDPNLGADELALRHSLYGERLERPLRSTWPSHANSREPERVLRIGFVSGDFREHPVGHFMADLLANLKAGRLELYAYANHRKGDALTDRIRPHFVQWREVHAIDDDALAAQIRADEIDVLVDLSGHTGDNRLPVFARKPAPVQVTYLGYSDTTGLSAMDYIVGDPRMLPEAEAALYVEKPWRLPDTSLCFTPPDLPVEVGPLPAAQKGFITFGCLNKSEKISSAAVETWAGILHAVPGSRLLLQNKPYDDPDIAASVRDRFAARGITGDRIELIGKLSWQAHFETYNRVDIALDPFLYNGTTTSVEGLWMGVPFVALKGDRLVAHMGESILHAMGMQAWIAASKAEYVAKAVAFAADLDALAELRAGLRQRLLASPICDAPRFAENLEQAFRGMWRAWCASEQN